MSLRSKFCIGILCLIGVLGLCQYLLTIPTVTSALHQSLDDKGRAVALTLARQATAPLLANDSLSLQRMVDKLRDDIPDLLYAFILSPQGEVLAHTFGRDFPPDLRNANPVSAEGPVRHRHLSTVQGMVHDTAVAVLDGAAGVVRVGFAEDKIAALLHRTSRAIFLTTLFLGIFGILLAFLLGTMLTRPLTDLARTVRAFGQGDFSARTHVTGDDEIGELGRAFNLMAHDLARTITEMREAQDRLAAIFENAAVGITLSDPQGYIVQVNPAFARMLGQDEAEIVGRHISEVTMPEDRGSQRKKYQALLQGETDHVHFQKRYLHRQGRPVWAQVTLSLLRDQEGRPTMVIGMIEDISYRKLLEEEHLKRGRLESISVLAGGIAHDFNNLLTAILGNLILAQHKKPDDESFQELLASAEKAALHAKELTDKLLAFASEGTPSKTILHPCEVLEETCRLLLAGTNVRFELHCAADLAPVTANRRQVEQVFQNIIKNSLQAMPEGGTIEVRAENTELGSKASLPAGRYVKLTFTDQGHGIATEHLDKIFDPYFTTRNKGDGLGLALSYAIIKNHGGLITVSSQPGRGTSFVVYLPAAEEERPSAPDHPPKKAGENTEPLPA